MADGRGTNDWKNRGNCSESYADYLARAASACEAGDLVLGMHLYLAAYERAVVDPDIADGMALAGLREAWNLACDLKERSMAEYVFEKLEPFLTGEEIAECANKLQDLALDRLEEYGFSREDLQDMAEMITQDLIDGEGSVVKVESISLPHASAIGAMLEASDVPEAPEEPAATGDVPGEGEGRRAKPEQADLGTAAPDFNPYEMYDTSSVGTSYHAATNDGTGSYIFTRDEGRAAESERARAQASEGRGAEGSAPAEAAAAAGAPEPADAAGLAASPAPEPAAKPQASAKRPLIPPPGVPLHGSGAETPDIPKMPEVAPVGAPVFNYHALAGFDHAVEVMRDFGVGLQRDPGFGNFIKMMNARHGLDRMPALDTLLFRAPVIEDASRFVDATVGEIALPVLRMSMEEGVAGAPMLCVAVQGDNRPRMNHAHNRFEGPGVLVIEDLDMWEMPQMPEGAEGIAGFVMANMSRGAREAINLIRSAVEDPDVFVLATATTDGEVDPFFYDLLEPISIIDIANPDERERGAVWAELVRDHPSLRTVDSASLLRLSAGLSRFDLYMAARSALEDAYKAGLARRMFLPVTTENVLDKIAACFPFESDEYRAIEDAIAESFTAGLDGLEELVEGSADVRP